MNLKTAIAISSILILSSCARVRVKDGEWCADAGPDGASCFHTLSQKERDIPKEIWDRIEIGPDYRFGKICTDPENFTDWSKAILKLCRLTKACTFDLKNKVITFNDRVEKTYVEIKRKEREGFIIGEPDSEVSECERPGEEEPSGNHQETGSEFQGT